MRTMFDSTNPAAIPADAQLVAGYLSPSPWAWPPEAWARFPNAVHVRIAVRASTNDGHVLDVETGDATNGQAPGWVHMRRAAGADPSCYTSASNWPALRAAFQAAQVVEPHYWIAAYPGGGATVPDGAVAHQYADPATSGGDYDLSAVADYWPGVDGGTMDWSDKTPDGALSYGEIISEMRRMLAGVPGVHADGDMLTWQQGQFAAIQAQLTALSGALSSDEATLLGAIQGADADVKAGVTQIVAAMTAAPGGNVDVHALAAALAPLLPADATPAQIAAEVATAFAAHLAASLPVPTGTATTTGGTA